MSNMDQNINRAFAGQKTLLQDALAESMDQLIIQMKAEAVAQIQKQFYSINFEQLVNELVSVELAKKMKSFKFPDKSIPHKGINFDDFMLTGNNITGGIYRDFVSSGIEDHSNTTELTIMDNMVVVESEFVTRNLSVKGNTVFEGDVIFNGKVPIDSDTLTGIINDTTELVQANLEETIADKVNNAVHGDLQTNGLDVSKLSVNGKPLIDNHILGPFITESKLTTVGKLKELMVVGETTLPSLFSTNKRVGINTLSPSAALAIWDEETEIIIGKRKSQCGYIGTARSQELVIGANNKENIALSITGETLIDKPILAGHKIYSVSELPTFKSTLGAIALNANPKSDEYWGWMCLGENKWRAMGKFL